MSGHIMALGQYRAAGITLTDAQVAKPQMDTAGNIKVTSGASGATADQVQGNVASGATDAGSPVKVAGVYNSTMPTYTTGQRGDLQIGSRGALKVQIMAVDGNSALADANGVIVTPAASSTFWNYAAASGGIVNTTTAVTIKAAAGAAVRNYLKSIQLVHDALGAATEIAIRDGASGTVLWRGKLQTAASDSALGSGTVTFDPPLRGTANTLMEFVTLTAVTGGVFVSAQGYTGS